MPIADPTPMNRIADILRSEDPDTLACFAQVLDDMLADPTVPDTRAALRLAAQAFPDPREHFQACIRRAREAREQGRILEYRPYVPTPVTWPQLGRTATGYGLERRETPGKLPQSFEPIDWLVPEVDDVTVVVTLLQNEIEAQRFVRAWDLAYPAFDEIGADAHGATLQPVPDGFAVVAWKYDTRNLVVWRDHRPYLDGALLAVVAPDGVAYAGDTLPEDLYEEFMI